MAAISREQIYPGSIVWAKHKTKDRPHLVLKVTDGGKDIFLLQVAVMSSKRSLNINSVLKLKREKPSYVHLNRLVELELKDIKSIDKDFATEDEFNAAVEIFKNYVDDYYDYAM
jgi:hypothetical protein